jgi:hypothetical protein
MLDQLGNAEIAASACSVTATRARTIATVGAAPGYALE